MLLQNKIHPDNLKVSSPIITRKLLQGIVSANPGCYIFVVKAPAGYGKTTILSEFITSSGKRCSFYKIDEHDDNLYTVFSYITASIKYVFEDFGNETISYLESFKNDLQRARPAESMVRNLITLISNELLNIKEEIYIILDDLHFLPDTEALNKGISLFVKNIPPNVKLFITTREDLRFSTGILAAKRKIMFIEQDLIALSKEQVTALALDLYKKDLTDVEAAHICGLTEGWVTGVHLFLQSGNVQLTESKLPGSIYEFFAEDIFEHLDNNIKKVLLTTSLLESFSTGLIEPMFKDLDVDNILSDLLAKNIFINKVEEAGRQTYFYNDLFRDFLKSKFEDTYSEKEKNSIYKELALLLEGNEQGENAVMFYIRANDLVNGIRSVKENIRKYLREDLSLAAGWIRSIPEDLRAKDKELSFYEGVLNKNFYLNYEAALDLFKRSLSIKEDNNEDLDIKSTAYIAEILINEGKLKEAEGILVKAIKLYKGPGVSLLYFNLSHRYLNESLYDKAELQLSKGLEMINSSVTSPDLVILRYDIMNNLGNVYFLKGDLVRASHYYELAAEVDNLYKSFQILINLLYVNSYSRKFHKAFEIKGRLEGYKVINELPDLRTKFLESLTFVFYELGDYERSLDTCGTLLKHSQKHKQKDSVFFALLQSSINHYYLKNIVSSEKYLELACKEKDENHRIQDTEIAIVTSLIEATNGNYEAAEANLKTSHQFLLKNGLDKDKVQIEFYLAKIYLKKGFKEKALNILTSSLQTAEDNSYINMFCNELLFNSEIFELAAENKVSKQFLDKVYSEVFSTEYFPYLSDASKARILAETDKLYSVKAICLGGPEIYFKNTIIEDKKWIRKGFREAFIYMLLNRKKHLTKDIIVEMFLGDVPYDHKDNIFHQLLSNIRSILKTPGKKGTEILIYKNKMVSFNEDLYYYLDIEQFLSSYEKIASSNKINTGVIMMTVEIYSGDLLVSSYDQWIEDIRTEAKNKYIDLLELGIKTAKQEQDVDAVIYFSECLIANDRTDEKAYIENIKANLQNNNKRKALIKLEQMKDAFQKELGRPPSESILQEADKLLL